MVQHPKCAPQCHLQTTAHSRRYVTHSDHCHTQYSFYALLSWMQVPPNRNAHSVFSLKPTAAVPCCPAVTSPPLTMMSTTLATFFLLLFADIAITPTLLEGLSEIDVLHMALGCRFALDISRFRSNFPLHLIPSHFPTILSSPHFEHGYTCFKTGHIGQLVCLTMLVERDSHSNSHSMWQELVVTQCQLKTR